MGAFKRRQLAEEDGRSRAATLGDLRDGAAEVLCRCNRCGHTAVLATARLIGELGPALPVPEIGGRMRCSGCGGKDVATQPWPPAEARHA